jgi:PAS domain S-box-containing protein
MKILDVPNFINNFQSASAELLAAVLDQSVDCIKVIGPTGALDFMNRNGRCSMEVDDFAAIAGKPWWELWPDESKSFVLDAVERARGGKSTQFEAFCPTAKGSPRWWDVSVAPVLDAQGELQALVSVSRDITAKVRTRELHDAASAEMRHRLQNAYALAGAVVASSARGDVEREKFAAEILDKLERLGIAQRVLLDTDRLGPVTLDKLVRHLTAPFQTDGCKVEIGELPAAPLDEDQVRALALTFGELSTNSNKYGAMGYGGSLRIGGEKSGRAVTLRWSETSSRRVDTRKREGGNGFTLIRRALGAHGGSIDIDWRDDGLDVAMVLPVAA